MSALPVFILAVDDARLLRMQLQPTVIEATLDAVQDRLRLLLRLAVRDNIVRVTFERNIRMLAAHPFIERQVQKNIGQKRTGDSPYTVGNLEIWLRSGDPQRGQHERQESSV